jgi:hypothetical protein
MKNKDAVQTPNETIEESETNISMSFWLFLDNGN